MSQLSGSGALGSAWVELRLDESHVPADLAAFRAKLTAGLKPQKVDFLNALPSTFREVADQTAAATEQLKEFRRLSLGGELKLPGFEKFHAENLRRQQTAALTTQVDTSQTQKLAALQQSIALEKVRAKYAASPEGAKALREEVRLQRELKTTQGAGEYAKRAAELGTFQAALIGAQDKLSKLDKATTAAGVAFAAGTASIFGFLAAASPNAMATFEASLKGLSISIGGSFVPYLDQMSLGLQKAAIWVDHLDRGFKGMAAKVVVGAVALSGAYYGTTKLLYGFAALTAGVVQFGVAMWGLALNPWTWAFAGLAVVIGGVGLALHKSGEQANYFKNKMSELEDLRRRLQAGEALKTTDIGRLSPEAQARIRQAQRSGDKRQMEDSLRYLDKQAQDIIAGLPEADIQKRVEQARQILEAATTQRYTGIQSFEQDKKIIEGARAKLINLGVSPEALKDVQNALHPKDMPNNRASMLDRIEAALRLPIANAQAQLEAVRALAAQRGIPLPGSGSTTSEQLKRSLVGRPTARIFETNQELADFITLASLNAGTPEADNWQKQIEILEEVGGLLKEIRDNSKAWTTYSPAWTN
jgi:hypothetical protein